MIVSFVHRFIWIVFRPIVSIFANFTVLGSEQVKGTGAPMIFVANHESHFDPFLISAAVPLTAPIMPIRFFTRDIFFKQFFFKHILRLLGAFPGRIGAGMDTAAIQPLRHLESGRSIGVFPEWCFPSEPDLSRMGAVGPEISLRSQRPIIPTYLFGIQNLRWGKLFSRRKNIIVSFAEPLVPEPGEAVGVYTRRVERGLAEAKYNCLRYLESKNAAFWESYAKFYKYLELAAPYRRMQSMIRALLPAGVSGHWLDLGTGSGAMTELLLQGQSGLEEIVATDFNSDMLAIAAARFRSNPIVKVQSLDLAREHPFASAHFDGVVANLVLPYVLHFEGIVGVSALRHVLVEIYRVLKPGGMLLWSTPKRRVNFVLVALASWRSFLDRSHPEYRRCAFEILKHALQIQEWGRREMYNFLSLDELETLLQGVGFGDVAVELALAGQVYIITCRKPNEYDE